MAQILRLSRMEHGSDFSASTLRDTQNLGVLDPVLGVDHARISGPTFPPHPHAGFSAVSYVFPDAATGLENEDSIGTRNSIRPGGLHWTAAGRGIVHEEVPTETGKPAHMFQIFINLPVEKQSDPPFALSIEPEDVPVVDLSGVSIRVPLGSFGDVASPLSPPTQINLLDISLDAGASLEVPVAAGHNAFAMPVRGALRINGQTFADGGETVPAFAAADQEQSIEIEAEAEDAQVAVFSGLPLRQPVHWHGPMALASQAALAEAVQAFRQGAFGQLPPQSR